MSREFQFQSLASEVSEPIWPYDLDDSYLQLDLGENDEATITGVQVMKKPWFKQNYRHSSQRNPKFYRRPYFQMETP